MMLIIISKNLRNWYQTCNTGRVFILGRYHKMSESLNIRVIIWPRIQGVDINSSIRKLNTQHTILWPGNIYFKIV